MHEYIVECGAGQSSGRYHLRTLAPQLTESDTPEVASDAYILAAIASPLLSLAHLLSLGIIMRFWYP